MKQLSIALILLAGLTACDLNPNSETNQNKASKKKPSFIVKLLGPGERGNFFQLVSNDISFPGKCFEGEINGVKGFGKFLSKDTQTYNLFVYFHGRHSPRSDWQLLEDVVPGKSVPVELKVSKCSKNGFYDPSRHIASYSDKVVVSP